MWPGEGRRGFKIGVKLIQALGSAESLRDKEEKGEAIPGTPTPK